MTVSLVARATYLRGYLPEGRLPPDGLPWMDGPQPPALAAVGAPTDADTPRGVGAGRDGTRLGVDGPGCIDIAQGLSTNKTVNKKKKAFLIFHTMNL